MDFEVVVPITKIDEEKHLVFGWFSVVKEGGVPVVDHDNEIIKIEELEKAAYDFVIDARIAGDQHIRKGVGVLVESIVFTLEKQKTLGINLGKEGWWGGFKVLDDEVWKSVKDGTFECFSIGGKAERVELEGA